MTERPEKSAKARGKGFNFIEMGLGTHFIAMLAAGFILGFVVDTLLETFPFALLIGGVLGFIGGALKLLEIVNHIHQVKEDD